MRIRPKPMGTEILPSRNYTYIYIFVFRQLLLYFVNIRKNTKHELLYCIYKCIIQI